MNTFFAWRKYFHAEFNFSRMLGFWTASSISYGLILDLLNYLENSFVMAFEKDFRLILDTSILVP